MKKWWQSVPVSQKRLLVGLAFAGLALLSYLVLPSVYRQGTTYKTKSEQLKKQIDLLKAESSRLDEKEAAVSKELHELQELVSEDAARRTILDDFSTKFAAAYPAVEFVEITPANTITDPAQKEGDKATYIPLHVSFHSDYEGFYKYLGYMEGLPRPIRIRSLSVTMEKDSKGQLLTELDIALYVKQGLADPYSGGKSLSGVPADQGSAGYLSFIPKPDEGADAAIKVAGRLMLTGFMGDKVLLGDETYAVGDEVQGWKIGKIEPMRGEVTLVRGTTEKVLSMENPE